MEEEKRISLDFFSSKSPPPEIIKEPQNKINQGQFYEIITSENLSWQQIIYDLVKTEQLDPWNIEIGILADRYLEIIKSIEEMNFFVSSKVLYACSLLLRLKSELILSRYIEQLNVTLYGIKTEKKYEFERIEIDENDLPMLIPRTPLPRFRRVTLQELMSALNKAIETENRRIKREIKEKQAEKISMTLLAKYDRVPLKDRIKKIYENIQLYLNQKDKIKMSFSEIAQNREEKLAAFLPILHLTNEEKLFLEQQSHFEEIYMALERLQTGPLDYVAELEDLPELEEKSENFEELDEAKKPVKEESIEEIEKKLAAEPDEADVFVDQFKEQSEQIQTTEEFKNPE